MPMFDKFGAYARLTRIDRPIGMFLLLWPTLWALWLASDGQPDPTIVIVFIVGTYLMRAAGCAINDYADRDFDGQISRTYGRPLATGELAPTQALTTFSLLLVVAFGLVLFLNIKTILLSFGGALIAAVYPFAKRVTNLPQLVLGIAFSWGIPMAYTALTNSLPAEAWILFIANFAWIVAYDTQYAMSDREDDIKAGIKSTAILFGRYDNLIIGVLHLATLCILFYIGLDRGLSWHFNLGLGLAGGFAIYQQWLCKDRDPVKCFQAFINNSWFGSMVFIGLVLALLADTM